MGFKKIEQRVGFAELALSSSMKKNRSLDTLKQTDKVIDWPKIEKTLLKYYKIGIRDEGADAYPPLMLLKCLLLQKWFRIPSDPELESQINDRISFKSFLKLPFDMPSPDHSTFSRFRKRLSKNAMIKINSEVLKHFANEGLSINEGIAIDARLVQSASRPISNDEIKDLREKRQTPEGNLDKNGKPLKFSRDLESDWVVQNDEPPACRQARHYGLKEHASVDINMRKNTTTAKLTEYEKERNKKISKKRYIVEQYFGLSHLHDRAKRARFATIIKNTIDAMCRQAAFNITRGGKLLGFT